jgi:hypothetical protein
MNRRQFMQTSASLTAIAFSPHAHAHHFVNEAPLDASNAAPPPPLKDPVLSGSGEFRYQYVPEKLVLPPEVKMRNGHGLCLDKQGNIYFTYEPEKVDEQTRSLVRFAPDGTAPVLLGTDNALAHGVPHGLNIDFDKDGHAVLYHANNDATVHKTTLDGQVLWTQKWAPQMGNYKPTDAVAPPGSDRVLIADGYGSSMIHAPDLNGPCIILDKDNQVVSVIEVGKLLGDYGFRHPHDAIWLANGDIAVCTWNPGRLGYWKRLS